MQGIEAMYSRTMINMYSKQQQMVQQKKLHNLTTKRANKILLGCLLYGHFHAHTVEPPPTVVTGNPIYALWVLTLSLLAFSN